MKYVLAAIILILLVGGCVSCANKTYSVGERTGVITKISYKGLVWKTYEGEMNLGGMSADQGGTMVPVRWSFTAPSALKEAIEDAAKSGKRVTVKYRQPFIQWPWNGESDYNVEGLAGPLPAPGSP